MKQSREERALELAEWFSTQAQGGTANEADLMARAALALERVASKPAPAIANDNHSVAKRRVRH